MSFSFGVEDGVGGVVGWRLAGEGAISLAGGGEIFVLRALGDDGEFFVFVYFFVWVDE